MSESRHVSIGVDNRADEVYDYVRNPANLAEWAQGLGSSLREVDGRWVADSAAGRIEIAFVPRNDFGVADHDVTLPDGTTLHVHLRVLADGAGCEVVFTARRLPGMSDDDFARDVDLVAGDLATLKQVVEGRQG
ncbi:SRPBCC family protein [uncultured Jatrophihabitans sp.]|uniref:SRPBCC family protein n=1 Tax=uncultured Jatrophihabitans sp. TaxID=1610747 RepID=UPI0035CB2671